jgi:hypothetical protein
MRNTIWRASVIATAAALGAAAALTVARPSGQAARPARTADNHPNFNGI